MFLFLCENIVAKLNTEQLLLWTDLGRSSLDLESIRLWRHKIYLHQARQNMAPRTYR